MATEQVEHNILNRPIWSSLGELAYNNRHCYGGTQCKSQLPSRSIAEQICKPIDKPYRYQTNTRLIPTDKGVLVATSPDVFQNVKINTFLDLDRRIADLDKKEQGLTKTFEHFMTFVETKEVPILGADGATEVYGVIKEDILKPDSGFKTSSISKMLRIAAEYLGVKAFFLPLGLRNKVQEMTIQGKAKIIPHILAGWDIVRFMDGFSSSQIREIVDESNPNTFPMRDYLQSSNVGVAHKFANGEPEGQRLLMSTNTGTLYPTLEEEHLQSLIRNVPDYAYKPTSTGFKTEPPKRSIRSIDDVIEMLRSTNAPAKLIDAMSSRQWAFDDISSNKPVIKLIPNPSDTTKILNPANMQPIDFSTDSLLIMDLKARLGDHVNIDICDGVTLLAYEEERPQDSLATTVI